MLSVPLWSSRSKLYWLPYRLAIQCEMNDSTSISLAMLKNRWYWRMNSSKNPKTIFFTRGSLPSFNIRNMRITVKARMTWWSTPLTA